MSDRRHDLTIDLRRWSHTDRRGGPRSLRPYNDTRDTRSLGVYGENKRGTCAPHTHVSVNERRRMNDGGLSMPRHRPRSTSSREPGRYRPVPLPRNQLIAKLAGHYRWQMQFRDERFNRPAARFLGVTSAVGDPHAHVSPRTYREVPTFAGKRNYRRRSIRAICRGIYLADSV